MIRTISRGRRSSLQLPIASCLVLVLGLALNLIPQANAESTSMTDKQNDLLATISGVPENGQPSNTMDGGAFINSMLKAAQSFTDYSFTYTMTVYKGRHKETEGGRFWFKKPRLLKIVVDSGKQEGAVAILAPDGKVWATPPKSMGPIVHLVAGHGVPLSPDSHFLKSINGYPMVNSDFTSLAEALTKFLSEGETSKVTVKPVTVPGRAKPVYILELYKSGALWKRVYVDPELMVPTEWFDNDNGKLYTYSVWHEFKPNLGLRAEDFTVSKKK